MTRGCHQISSGNSSVYFNQWNMLRAQIACAQAQIKGERGKRNSEKKKNYYVEEKNKLFFSEDGETSDALTSKASMMDWAFFAPPPLFSFPFHRSIISLIGEKANTRLRDGGGARWYSTTKNRVVSPSHWARSLTHSRAHGKVNDQMSQYQAVLNHKGAAAARRWREIELRYTREQLLETA